MLLCAALVAAVVSASPGVLGADPREVVLYRPGPHPAGMARGSFVDDDRGLHLPAAPRSDDVMLWPDVPMADGLVRARFVVGKQLKSTVLVRARADALTSTSDAIDELDGGYGIELEGSVLRLRRTEHRMDRLLGVEAALSAKPVVGSVVEVAALVVGPWLSVTVYDGASMKPLAHVEAVDRGFVAGAVGVRMARQQDEATTLVLLSVAAMSKTAAWSSTTTPDLTMDGAGTGAGTERVLRINAADVVRLPAGLRRGVMREGDQAVVVTDLVGVEQVLRLGVSLLEHRTQLPYKYMSSALRAHLGKPPTMTSTGPRLDESYKDAAMVEAIVRAFAERYPTLARVEELGRSREGRPILALVISDHANDADVDEGEPAVLLDGAHHGGELISTEIVLDAIERLLLGYGNDVAMTRAVDALAIWCVPLVNVDGNHRYIHETRDYDRKNSNDVDNNGRLDGWDGVDLYRQYPVRWGQLGEVGSRSWPYHYRYRGAAAASEPEIVAMMQLAQRERFAASIDFHTASTKVLVPYTDPSMKNPADNEAWAIAEALVQGLPKQASRKRYTVARNLYPVDGTAQDWFRFAFGTVALLVEAPQHNPPFDQGRNKNVVGARPLWQRLLATVAAGPQVRVRVVDAAGAPVEAVVSIAEQPLREGERWTTRPRDGRTVRFRPRGGRTTVVVEHDGTTERRVVEVGKGPVDVNVVLAG
jgi:hypothetical protein